MVRPSISFVVPVRNDAERLRACLARIRESTPTGIGIEIVVADNGSTDASPRVARNAGARLLELPGLRVGELRNRAARAATGDILAFVDADNEIQSEWIDAAIDALSSRSIAAVGAPYHAPSPGTWVQRCYDRLRKHPTSREPAEWLGSGNMAVRRAAFEEVGGFDVDLETCEDVDLCRKLRAAGYALVADHRMKNVHHGDPSTLGQVFSGELWRGRDNVRVSLRRPVSGRTLASAVLPVANLVAFVTVLIGPVVGGDVALGLSLTAGLFLLLVIGLRASAMARDARAADWLRACAVAAAYEAGRALALTGWFGYRRRRRAALA